MNVLMTGMVLTMSLLRPRLPAAGDPSALAFWFVMSMALLAGFAFAYPMNWWLVAHGLKHGMITVRPHGAELGVPGAGLSRAPGHAAHSAGLQDAAKPALVETLLVTLLSIVGLATAIVLTA